MAKFLVNVYEERVVTYAVTADTMEEAEYIAEYEAESAHIVRVDPVGREVTGCELA